MQIICAAGEKTPQYCHVLLSNLLSSQEHLIVYQQRICVRALHKF